MRRIVVTRRFTARHSELSLEGKIQISTCVCLDKNEEADDPSSDDGAGGEGFLRLYIFFFQ